MAEEGVSVGGQVRFLHQLRQVFDGGDAEAEKVGASVQVLGEPAAERMSARLMVKETPGLAGGGVVAFVELLHQVLAGLTLDLFGAAEVKNGRAAVGLLVDLVDCAVANGHCSYLRLAPASEAGGGNLVLVEVLRGLTNIDALIQSRGIEMSWFDLDIDGFKYLNDFAAPDTQAIVVHAKLDEASKLTVETTTDWAIVLIGVGSLLSTLVMGIFTYRAQKQQIIANSEGLKNQVRANAASLRNVWMEQLRAVSSEFLQCVTLVNAGLSEEIRSQEDAASLNEKKHQALLLQIRMKLYVGTTSPLAKKIVKTSERILESLGQKVIDPNYDDNIPYHLTVLEELLVAQIEQAWSQAKADLGLIRSE